MWWYFVFETIPYSYIINANKITNKNSRRIEKFREVQCNFFLNKVMWFNPSFESTVCEKVKSQEKNTLLSKDVVVY